MDPSGRMQSSTPIPPPRLPPPRVALQDVTARANQSPVPLPTIGKAASSVKPAGGESHWGMEQAKARYELDALRDIYRQTAVDVRSPTPASAVSSNPFKQPASASSKQALAAVSAPTVAPAAPAANSRKRKSDASSSSSDEAIAAYKQPLDHIDVDDMAADRDCTYVRNMIQKVIDRGIFKKGEFCDTIGSSHNSVNRFLAQTGRDGGFGSDAYWNAWAWFKKRELAGLSMPAASTATQKKAKTAKARLENTNADLSNIHLEGEETDSVPVYETCDVVRRKITAHLKTPGLTQAQFCRDLYAQLKAPGCKSIQSKQLADFRKKKGARAGCTSTVFYAAYVYFEKRRLADRKPKSKHRLDMEEIWPGGLDRERDPNSTYYISHVDTRMYEDEYGQLECVRIR